MTSREYSPDEVRSRLGKTLLLGCTIVAFLAGIAWWCGLLGGSAPVQVDFRDVAKAEPYSAPDDSRPVLRVAVAAMISPKPTSKHYEGLLRLIGEKVGRRVAFSQRKTYAEVNELLEQKEIDLAFVCSGPYVSGRRQFGMEILAVPVVHGETVYCCYFLANGDSTVECFEDLRGKTFAFTDPHSNTGCLVPKYVLAQRGDTPESFFGETFFSHSHDNSIKAVAEGLADGAAVDQLIWDFIDATDSTYTSRTKIIEKSPPYGIPPVVVHPDLDEDLKRRLRDVFLSFHEDQEGHALLGQLHIDRFVEGSDAMYDSVRKMQRWVAENGQEDE